MVNFKDIQKHFKISKIDKSFCAICNGHVGETRGELCQCLYCKNCLTKFINLNKNLFHLKDCKFHRPFNSIFEKSKNWFIETEGRQNKNIKSENKVEVFTNFQSYSLDNDKNKKQNDKTEKYDILTKPKDLFIQSSSKRLGSGWFDNSNEIACFRWEIKNLLNLRNRNQEIASGYFFSHCRQYEMWLYFYPKGSEYNDDFQISFRLWIQSSHKYDSKWPFLGQVTLAIWNSKKPTLQESITVQLNGNISLLKPFYRSDPINFSFPKLQISNDFDSLTSYCSVSCCE